MSGASPLDRLAARLGVLETYHDLAGREHRTSPETARALAAAMGHPADSDAEAAERLAEIESDDGGRIAPAELVIEQDRPFTLPLRGRAEWRLVSEDGEAPPLEGAGDGEIALPALGPGIYAIELEGDGRREEALLIVSPGRAPALAEIAGRNRAWGLTAALYGLRSRRDLGLGDYDDLAAAAEATARHGAAFIGINPIHAIGAGDRATTSPYSPTSRAFFDTRHIAIDLVPGFADCDGARRLLRENAARIETLRAEASVDYGAVMPLLRALQEALFAGLEARGGKASPEGRRAAEDPELERFATFEAIAETHGPDWRVWPAALRDSGDPAVAAFAAANRRRLGFHEWLQHVADGQLATAQARARSAGMALGLYLDLAVGARPGGAEAWMEQSAIARGVSLGAPPDALSPEGQRWDLAAYSPEALRRSRYRPFVKVLRAAMRHAGLVRIDHALGMARGFWIPENGAPGGYVRFPTQAMLAIVAIEARRAGTVVIGEDLGLVPEGFRDELRRAGLYGYAVMQFEKDADGRFRDPAGYDRLSLAAFGTHDTPTLEGYRTGRDIEWWRRLGWIGPEQADETAWQRVADVQALARGAGEGDGLATAVHGALAGSSAELVAVQLDDVLGEAEAQNLPGTIAEHPNWQRRHGVAVEDLGGNEALGRTGALMASAGRGG